MPSERFMQSRYGPSGYANPVPSESATSHQIRDMLMWLIGDAILEAVKSGMSERDIAAVLMKKAIEILGDNNDG